MEHIEKLNSGVMVELGGETRKLEYTIHSVVQYKLLTGKNLLRGELDTTEPTEITGLVWAGLISNDESFDGEIDSTGKQDESVKRSLKQIAKWLTFHKIAEIGEAIQLAFNQATSVLAKKKG